LTGRRLARRRPPGRGRRGHRRFYEAWLLALGK